jgi:hypothetical protein
MHSLLHRELGNIEAADRIRRAHRAESPIRRRHPPPLRGRLAYAAVRLASRLDGESARKAIARQAP